MNDSRKITAIIQVRMCSSRLPGKALLPACGKPMLELLIDRLKGSRLIDQIWVATTTNHPDQAIVDLCDSLSIPSYRGSESDVLQRIVECANQSGADVIVEITGDNPLVDPRLIDEMIDVYQKNDYDYVSNFLTHTYPVGMYAQVYSTEVLRRADVLTNDPSDREHVSLYIYQHPGKFSLYGLELPPEKRRPKYRLTLDTPEDYKLIKMIFEKLYPAGADFSLDQIVLLLDNDPSLPAINAHIRQRTASRHGENL